MSTWLTEAEFRQSGGKSIGVTINPAFLNEIKEDHVAFRSLAKMTRETVADLESSAHQVANALNEFLDRLETYFSLEEFYGYFESDSINGNDIAQVQLHNPQISAQAILLRSEHELLFREMVEIVDKAEQILYREHEPELTPQFVAERFDHFLDDLDRHEQQEMELVMRLHNEVIGVGD